jgi:hypothetical protein
MDVKLTMLFLIISTIIGLSDHSGDKKLRASLKQAGIRVVARMRQTP